MALSREECEVCRVHLDALKDEYRHAGEVPAAEARLAELETALERECPRDDDGSNAAGAAIGLLGALAVWGIFSAWLGSRR